ncbi:MAG: penicillin-insensitive murein endopeptidase [Deltaproteobacteria bacterium]
MPAIKESAIKTYIPKITHTSVFLMALLLLAGAGQSDALDASVTESIGSYTAGCIRNSTAIPRDGEGFQVIRPGRGRFYAHPDTVNYIKSLASKVDEQLNGILLIGDVAQRTGGPMFDEHSSHQTGLDADILLWQHPIALNRSLTFVEREHIHPQSVLTDDERRIDEFKWNDNMGEILKLAASDNRVDRIFVNPLIKKKLCRSYEGEKWLAKIRPWYGHDGHFHVRLRCPPGNHLCVPQKPLNIYEDGCGSELDSWFTADGSVKSRKASGKSIPPRLPDECIPIVNGLY